MANQRARQSALNDLNKRGYAQNTIDGAHRTGRMIFKKAIELEILKKDPTQYTQVPKQQKTIEDLEGRKSLPNYLEKDEFKHFLQITKKFGLDQDYSIFLLMAYTVVSAGELCALKWRDIDFEEQTISISKTYYNPTNNRKEYKLLPPKTPAAVRIIDIDETVINELSKHKLAQKQTMMKTRRKMYIYT